MDFTKEQRKTAYQKLPEKLQDFISDSESTSKIDLIASKFSLTESQSGFLYDEILLIMIGLETEGELVKHLLTRLSVDKITATEIFYEVDKNILANIKTLIPKIDTNITKEVTPEVKAILFKNLSGNNKTQSEVLLPPNSNLLEDALGNKDNALVLPKEEVSSTPTPVPFVSQPSVDQKLEALAENSGVPDQIIAKQYADKPDPYREPIG